MSKEKVEVLIEGGKASAGPAMGQKFGPLKVNIQGILEEINKRTADFKGMKVPVTVIVDTETKEFELEIGTPPTSELVKKELAIQKGSGKANIDKVGNLAIEQVIKIAKMKQESLLVNNLKAAIKTVVGSCGVMGVLVEGKEPKEINEEINAGKYDKEIKEERTEVSEEKKKEMKDELEEAVKELEKEAAELEKEKEAAKPVEAPAEEVKEGEEEKEEGKEEEKAGEKKPEEKKEEPKKEQKKK